MLKRSGEATSPCRTPVRIGNSSDMSFRIRTLLLHLRSKTAELAKEQQLKMAKQEIDGVQSKLSEVSEKLYKGEMDRRKLHDQILELKGNIRVFCRECPLLPSDHADNIEHVQFPNNDEKSILLARTEESHIGRDSKDQLKYRFSFDRVFPPRSSQQEVFEEISLLVQSALDGYNVCIFAYGQTGSGKTYTMEGPAQLQDDTMGIIPRAVHQVFNSAVELKDQGWQYTFTASFLEIYDETIRDLLVNKTVKKMEHEIKRPTSNAVHVSNLKYLNVETVEEVMSLIKVAKQNRATAHTKMNDQSSRSHSVFQLKIEGLNKKGNITSTLTLIDLVGSERIDKSESRDRLKETKAINCSLSNLGGVFIALANKDTFVPYRNSKLTYLLQNCLGGNKKVLMFVNISPKNSSFGESLNSLRFASKVNKCVIGTAVANRK
ncbi:carboxy-terminal kinesin 2-like [Erpetoichthys calabaricus]|uniref:carboxy-terminal kinesin 2-like n=1 Tax=Erpetoichthys calabaricus TaxID=27687 RepID=UPI002233F999|nr:carboxy-terminal kinesin 2-like [Erpetoichthys calabaricus]